MQNGTYAAKWDLRVPRKCSERKERGRRFFAGLFQTPIHTPVIPSICHRNVRPSATDQAISIRERGKLKTSVLAVFFVLASCVKCLAGTTGVIHGYVRDATGKPVANALVTATSPSQTCTAYTDKRGFYVCMALPPDVYSVVAQKTGTYGAYSGGVRVSSDQATFLVFQFDSYPRCQAFTPAPLSAAPFISLDVRRMETYPRNVAPPIPLPMASTYRPPGCL